MGNVIAVTDETKALVAAILPIAPATTTAATDALYAAVTPVHAALQSALDRANAVETLRRAADAAENAPEVFALFESIKNTNQAMIRIASEISNAFDRLTDSAYQLDAIAQRTDDSINGRDLRLNILANPPAPPAP